MVCEMFVHHGLLTENRSVDTRDEVRFGNLDGGILFGLFLLNWYRVMHKPLLSLF